MARLSLTLLGPFQVALAGGPVTAFESDKERALLAYLAVEADRPWRRETLAGLLWPDHPERAARHSLSQALSNLRRALGDHDATPPALRVTREVVAFDRASDHWLDVVAFECLLAACDGHAHARADGCAACARRLEEAAGLYRGPFLDGLTLPDSPEFEQWELHRRERLGHQVLDALARLGRFHERRGAHDRVSAAALRQLALDPCREEAHRQLMRAYHRAGERAAALAQYERCRRVLAAELGVEPEAATVSLAAQVRDTPADTGRAPARRPHLPMSPTPFVGREAELARLAALWQAADTRLVTIVGPGGIGKTRLALQCAAAHADDFADGAAFVSLVPLRVADLIAPAIAAAVGLSLRAGEDPARQLVGHLRDRELLLVLDNAEHLPAGAGLLADLLRGAPGLRLLVTSRARLGLRAEWVVELGGLAYPGGEPAGALASYDAARLFLQTAARLRPGFARAAGDEPAVRRICQLTEGLPLALELAASWARVLSCREIAVELARGLGFLAGAARDLPARHRSMGAVFDGSWRLLSTAERRALRRLAVFRGGFGREAAEEVAGATLTDLAGLVDKSLLRAYSRADGETRYDLHELVRQYARERLEAVQEAARVRDRHLRRYLALAEEAEPQLVARDQEAWLARLAAEHDNLRAAFDWALASAQGAVALQLAGALWHFWWVRGHVGEGRRRLEAALAGGAAASAAVRVRALHGAGWLTALQHDDARAGALLREGLAAAEALGEPGRVTGLLDALGESARWRGDLGRAAERLTESAARSRAAGNTRGLAVALADLGAVAHAARDEARAVALLEEGLALLRQLGDTVHTAWTLAFLGRAAKEQGDHGRAAARLTEACGLFGKVADRDGLAFTTEGLAGLAAARGDAASAARLFGAAEAQREAIGSPMMPVDRPEYERDVAAARAQLDASAFVATWAEGRTLALEQAVAYALEEPGDA